MGMVGVYQVTPGGEASLLANYGPSDQYPCYRKYFINGLPRNCCGSPIPGIVQLQAMCKREFIYYTNDMDELLISNLEALTLMCQSIRYSEIETATSAQMQAKSEKDAIKLLQNELDHYLGRDRPAVAFSPFGKGDRAYSALGFNT
jgi:hypothetical protein